MHNHLQIPPHSLHITPRLNRRLFHLVNQYRIPHHSLRLTLIDNLPLNQQAGLPLHPQIIHLHNLRHDRLLNRFRNLQLSHPTFHLINHPACLPLNPLNVHLQTLRQYHLLGLVQDHLVHRPRIPQLGHLIIPQVNQQLIRFLNQVHNPHLTQLFNRL